jgi:hypothetical protein
MIRPTSLKPGRRSRRGITILETLIAATGVAMMLGLCAVTLHLLLRLNGASQARLGSAMAFEQLARQLREDVHDSETVLLVPAKEPAGKPANLHLTLEPIHLIAYEVHESSIVRLESRAGKRIRHESYDLLPGRTGRFELRDEAGSKLVALVVTHVSGPSRTGPPRPLEIVALVGKDRPRLLANEGDRRR